MRLARRGVSNADDVGLVGAAPQKGGPADAHDAVVSLRTRGF